MLGSGLQGSGFRSCGLQAPGGLGLGSGIRDEGLRVSDADCIMLYMLHDAPSSDRGTSLN